MARSVREARVLKVLKNGHEQTWEQVSSKLPDLEWNELFVIFDVLSRKGKITMHRRGLDYVVKLCHAPSTAQTAHTRDKADVAISSDHAGS
jgi:hypothetical protein